MTDFSALNARFGLSGRVIFREGPGGLAVAEVTNSQGSASIALQGAHLMTWTPRGHKPVIWLSRAARFAPGKSIRGGVPICWPWFGPHASNAALPAHGFARTVPWEVIGAQSLADGATRLDFRLIQNEATHAQWPHATLVECRITVGAALEIDLVTRNADRSAITIGDALHTYFQVSDVRRVTIRGLEGCPYLDKVDGGRRKQQSGAVTISAETDRIYLESSADCVIDDPGFRRRIRIRKRGSRSSVVWNPWIEKSVKMGDFGENGYLDMVCVESTNAADDVVTIAPGGEHHLWVRYEVESSD
ncbi:MAG: D-hexose-6-phosphate mutarotase [Gammaproteobacteria bacterium]|nr:D-hexose-6-phosphate mutarotase [Gammaproteobacteria bacterium]